MREIERDEKGERYGGGKIWENILKNIGIKK